MALVTATITVDFTANYAGNHRVCWRVQGSGSAYDCSTVVNCVGGGATCQAIFNAQVNTTSCDGTLTIEGYVQAECEDILSASGRLPFTADFIPNPTCERWELACVYSGVESVTVDTIGEDYLISDTVVFTRDGGDTQVGDATATITSVGTGVINSLTGPVAAGLGYVAAEILTIVGAAGAGATITIDTVDGFGAILTYTLTTNGAGYIGPFTFTGGSGAGADFSIVEGVDFDTFGAILGITMGAVGQYEIPPVVTITSGAGSGATFTAILEDCPARANVGTDCVGGDVIVLNVGVLGGLLKPGEMWATCLASGPNSGGAQYTDTQTGCCIPDDTDLGDPCTDHHIENASGGPVDVHYTGCLGDDVVVTIADATTLAVCAIVDGVVDPEVSGLTIANLGTPCV